MTTIEHQVSVVAVMYMRSIGREKVFSGSGKKDKVAGCLDHLPSSWIICSPSSLSPFVGMICRELSKMNISWCSLPSSYSLVSGSEVWKAELKIILEGCKSGQKMESSA